jgi:hypothetical protein
VLCVVSVMTTIVVGIDISVHDNYQEFLFNYPIRSYLG